MICQLRNMDQSVHAGNDLGKGAKGHQLDHTDLGGIAHLILLGKLGPGILAVVLHPQRDLALLGVEGDNVHIHLITGIHHLGRMLDPAPAQLGNMDHTVHTADVHKGSIRSERLYYAVIVLPDLDPVPDLSGLLRPLSSGHSPDRAHHTAAGTVDLGDAKFYLLLQHLGQGSLAGHTGLGRGHKHPNTLDADNYAALVLFRYDALYRGVLLTGLLHVVPALYRVEAFLGQGHNALHVIDAHDKNLKLLTHFHQILNLGGRIIGQLVHRNISGMLGPKIDLDLSRSDRSDHAGDLLPRMQSFDRLFQQFSKGFLDLHVFSTHFVIYLLYDPHRC